MAILAGVNEQMIVQYVVDEWKRLKDMRAEREEIWSECWNSYHCHFTKKWIEKAKEQNRSRRYIPMAWTATETVHSQLCSILFPGDDWLRLMPEREGYLQYDDKAAEDMQAFLRHQHRKTQFLLEYKDLLKQLIIFGNAPWSGRWVTHWAVDYPAYSQAHAAWLEQSKAQWQEYLVVRQAYEQQYKAAMANQQIPPPPPPGMQMPAQPIFTGMESRIFDGPAFDCGDLFNFVIDNSHTYQDMPLRISRVWKTKAHLAKFAIPDETGYAVYDNLNRLQDKDIAAGVSQDDHYLIQRAAAFALEVPPQRGIEMKQAWGTMEIPGVQMENSARGMGSVYVSFVAVVGEDSVLMRFEPTFLWSGRVPTDIATLIPTPGQVYGLGLIEKQLGQGDLINVRANQLVDAVAAVLDPELKAVNDGVVNLRQKGRPGGIRLVGNMDNLQPIEKNMQGIPIAAQELRDLRGDYQQGFFAIDPLSGRSQYESATRTARDANVVSTVLGQIAEHCEQNSLHRIIGLQLEMNQQFIEDDQVVPVIQDGRPSFTRLSPAVIKNQWGIVIRGSKNIAERADRLEKMLMLGQVAAGNPATMMFVKWLNWLKNLWQELGFRNADEIFVDEQTGEELMRALIFSGALVPMMQALGQGQPAGGASNVESGVSRPGPGGGPSQDAGGNGGVQGSDALLARQLQSIVQGGAEGNPGGSRMALPSRAPDRDRGRF